MSIQASIILEILRKKITFQIKISFQLKSNYQKYLIKLFYRPLSIVEKDDIILE